MDPESTDFIEDIGLIIWSLQDELKDVRVKLENLPGYPKGKVPQHLIKLQRDLLQVESNLQKKNDELIQNMMINFGETAQDLPYFKLPDIRRTPPGHHKDSSLGFLQASATKLKVAAPLRKDYAGKMTLLNKKRNTKNTMMKRAYDENFIPDPPPISDEDINRGMINLINKGIIPKDVDITPAFERGAPPLSLQPAKIYYGDPKDYLRREVATGPAYHKNVKYDLQPEEDRTLAIMPPPRRDLVPYQGALTGTGRALMNNAELEALPYEQDHGDRINDPEFDDPDIQKRNEDVRNYNQLMDEFSLHQFIIRKGKCLDDTPEFISFKRTYISKWGSISYIIHLLEKMLTNNKVPIAVVEGKKLVDLANDDLKKPQNEDLYDCLINQDEVSKYIKIPARMFTGVNGVAMAVICIQKYWRGFKARSAYNQLKFLMGKAAVIQKAFRLFQMVKATKSKIEELNNESLFVWREMMEEFKKRWPEIRKKKRIEIHVNSLSIGEAKRISMEKFMQRENIQIARLFLLRDPNVSIIYVSPFTFTNDVLGYYMKILQIGDIEEASTRLHIIVPENAQRFPSHYSLTQCLLYSPKSMKRIKNLIRGKQAYLVPGRASTDDIKLSINLTVPILWGEPQKINLYSTKSGCKRIFQQADVPTPISAFDIYDEQEFLMSLAKLIAHNLYVSKWIFKIDDEFNGRGHASFITDNVKFIAELRKQKKIDINDNVIENLIEVLQKQVPKKAKIACPSLYKTWKEYIDAFCTAGGVIEAAPSCQSNKIGSPSIAFFIDPDGEIQVIGSFDKFAWREYINAGWFFPQKSLPNMNLMTISKSIGEVLYEKQGVIGHVTVDLVSFPDPTSPNSHPLFWAVDINWYLTDWAAVWFFFWFLMEGQLDQYTGQYTIDKYDGQSVRDSKISLSKTSDRKTEADEFEERWFLYCSYIHHLGLATIQYKTFFHMCRLESISFDLEKRRGTTFILSDCLQSGLLSILTVGDNRNELVDKMVESLNFIQTQAGPLPIKNMNDDTRSDDIDVTDVFSKIRLIQKAMNKEIKKKSTKRNKDFVL